MSKGCERTLLVAMDCLNTITWIFMNTFLVAYFFNAAAQDVTLVSFYFMVLYGTTLGLAIIAGPMIKAGYRLMLYRLGIVLNFFALAWIMFAGEKIIYHITVCGLLLGSATALKSFTWKLMVSDTVSKKKIIKFRRFSNTIKGIVKITAPVLMGYFLTVESMGRLILFLLCLTATQWCISMFMKQPKIEPKGWFDLKTYFKKTRSDKTLKSIYIMEFFNGVSLSGVLNTVITLYIIYLFQTDFQLGIIISVFNGISGLSYFIFSKYCTYKRLGNLICGGVLSFVTAAVMFVLIPDKGTFIVYNFCFVSIVKIVTLIYENNMVNAADSRRISGSIKSEHFVVRQIFLNLGRVFSFALLTIGGFAWGFPVLKYYLVALSVLMSAMGLMAYLLNLRLEDNNPTELVAVK